MKVKVSEASGSALDYMVAKCEGWPLTWDENTEDFFLGLWAPLCFLKEYTPSTNWQQGGPIIEREKIGTRPNGDGWVALHINPRVKAMTGSTPLIAAMRCYCCSKLGDIVDVPGELCQSQNS